MVNRGMVQYYTYTPASEAGDPASTAAQSVPDSIANYGYKERVFRTTEQMTAAQADIYLASMLARYGQPVKQIRLEEGAGAGELYAVMELRGWWETLDWRFYTDARGRIGNKNGGTRYGLGISTFYKWAESLTVGDEAWTVSEIWVKMVKNGIPTDDAVVTLCANAAGAPGTALGRGVGGGWAIATDMGWVKYTLSAPVALSGEHGLLGGLLQERRARRSQLLFPGQRRHQQLGGRGRAVLQRVGLGDLGPRGRHGVCAGRHAGRRRPDYARAGQRAGLRPVPGGHPE